jgi:hypothetical protein
MYEVSVVALLISTCVGLVHNISPNSNLLLNANRLAVEHFDWRTPLLTEEVQYIVLNVCRTVNNHRNTLTILTADGQAAVGLYKGLFFEGMTVVNVTNSSILDDEDSNCPTSFSNTLVSSWYPDDGQLPKIKIEAAQSSDGNSSLMFDIVSLSIKPRQKRSSDPVVIEYKFWQLRNGKTEAIVLHQAFHSIGHHAVTHVEFARYGFYIRDLTPVEFAVVEDGNVDFAFCLDDLGVRIHT